MQAYTFMQWDQISSSSIKHRSKSLDAHTVWISVNTDSQTLKNDKDSDMKDAQEEGESAFQEI